MNSNFCNDSQKSSYAIRYRPYIQLKHKYYIIICVLNNWCEN